MTAREIIWRSVQLHPTLFRERLIEQADTHDNYARLTTNARAKDAAIASRQACLRVYDAVGSASGSTDIDTVIDRCSDMVIALNVAGKLQCLPRHVLTAAAVAWEEGQR